MKKLLNAIKENALFKESSVCLCTTKSKESNLLTVAKEKAEIVVIDLWSVDRVMAKAYLKSFERLNVTIYGFTEKNLRIAKLKIFKSLEDMGNEIYPPVNTGQSKIAA